MRLPGASVPSPALPGVASVLVAAILWGTTGTMQGLLPTDRDPVAVAVFRVAIAAAALLLFCLAGRANRAGIRELPLPRIALAGAAIALYNLFFFSGVSMAGVGVGTAIALGSGPIWVSLFERIGRGAKASRRQLMGQAVCIAGAVMLVASNRHAPDAGIGYAFAALAGLAYAWYSLITNRLGQAAPSGAVAAATFMLAAVFMAPLLLIADTGWVTVGTLPPLLFLGIVATGVAYYLFTFGVRRMAPSSAVTLALAEPLTAWLLATFVLREELTALKIAGAAILLLGLWIVARSLAPQQPVE